MFIPLSNIVFPLIFINLIAIYLTFAINCGFAPENVDKVENTPQGHLGFYPWTGAICLASPSVRGQMPLMPSCFCTSTLISGQFVLTAAHCIHGRKPNEIEVRLGSADYLNAREVLAIPARRLAIHPDYIFDLNGGTNDIGLIELAFPVPIIGNGNGRIHPICLNSSVTFSDRELAVVAGWGWIKNNQPGECAQPIAQVHPQRTNLLHQGHVQIVSDPRKCVLSKGTHPFTPGKEICTKGWDANPQHGDSGGPLMVKRMGRWHQIGVASYGECHEEERVPERLPDIFTSIAFYCSWIRKESGGQVQC